MKKDTLVDFDRWLQRRLKDPEFKKVYKKADEDPFVNIALQLISLREKHCLTQAKLAKKVKTSQQAIARLESMDYRGYNLQTLDRVAKALNCRLQVQFL